MPIMAPLADLVGVSRQVAVLAFQFGDEVLSQCTEDSVTDEGDDVADSAAYCGGCFGSCGSCFSCSSRATMSSSMA
jgi:hypothetical protein